MYVGLTTLVIILGPSFLLIAILVLIQFSCMFGVVPCSSERVSFHPTGCFSSSKSYSRVGHVGSRLQIPSFMGGGSLDTSVGEALLLRGAQQVALELGYCNFQFQLMFCF